MKQKMHKDIIISIAILTGFVFIVLFASYYVLENHKQGNICGRVIPIPIMIILLSSLGLFVGTLIYYFLSKKHDKEQKDRSVNAESTLMFLDKDERKIVKSLIKINRPVKQSELDDLTGLSRVKVFRILKRLEEKDIISKKEIGRTFIIELNENIKNVFG